MSNDYKQIPYGISDFKQVREENKYLVDKTSFFEHHGTGFYRDVFKLFKPMFDRIIMLGVSPITLDDLTSGYNIALNITMDPWFNQMLGFSEDDVRQMIHYYNEVGAIKPEVTEGSIASLSRASATYRAS